MIVIIITFIKQKCFNFIFISNHISFNYNFKTVFNFFVYTYIIMKNDVSFSMCSDVSFLYYGMFKRCLSVFG